MTDVPKGTPARERVPTVEELLEELELSRDGWKRDYEIAERNKLDREAEIERLRAGLREIAAIRLPPHGMGGRDALGVVIGIARRLLNEEA